MGSRGVRPARPHVVLGAGGARFARDRLRDVAAAAGAGSGGGEGLWAGGVLRGSVEDVVAVRLAGAVVRRGRRGRPAGHAAEFEDARAEPVAAVPLLIHDVRLGRRHVLADVQRHLVHLSGAERGGGRLAAPQRPLVVLLETDEAGGGRRHLLERAGQRARMLRVDGDGGVLEERRAARERVRVALGSRLDAHQRRVLLGGEAVCGRLERRPQPRRLPARRPERRVEVALHRRHRRRQRRHLVGGVRVAAPPTHGGAAVGAVEVARSRRVEGALRGAAAAPAGRPRRPAGHQLLDVVDVEVGLEGGDAGGRHRRELAARRTLDLVTALAHALGEARLAERVVARHKLGLVLVLVKRAPTDEAR